MRRPLITRPCPLLAALTLGAVACSPLAWAAPSSNLLRVKAAAEANTTRLTQSLTSAPEAPAGRAGMEEEPKPFSDEERARLLQWYQGKRMLVVDNERVVLAFLQQVPSIVLPPGVMLRTLDAASTFSVATSWLDVNPVDVCIFDYDLGDPETGAERPDGVHRTGAELARIVRRRFPEARILLLTGRPADEVPERALFDEIVQKPVTDRALLAQAMARLVPGAAAAPVRPAPPPQVMLSPERGLVMAILRTAIHDWNNHLSPLGFAGLIQMSKIAGAATEPLLAKSVVWQYAAASVLRGVVMKGDAATMSDTEFRQRLQYDHTRLLALWNAFGPYAKALPERLPLLEGASEEIVRRYDWIREAALQFHGGLGAYLAQAGVTEIPLRADLDSALERVGDGTWGARPVTVWQPKPGMGFGAIQVLRLPPEPTDLGFAPGVVTIVPTTASAVPAVLAAWSLPARSATRYDQVLAFGPDVAHAGVVIKRLVHDPVAIIAGDTVQAQVLWDAGFKGTVVDLEEIRPVGLVSSPKQLMDLAVAKIQKTYPGLTVQLYQSPAEGDLATWLRAIIEDYQLPHLTAESLGRVVEGLDLLRAA